MWIAVWITRPVDGIRDGFVSFASKETGHGYAGHDEWWRTLAGFEGFAAFADMKSAIKSFRDWIKVAQCDHCSRYFTPETGRPGKDDMDGVALTDACDRCLSTY